MRDKRIITAGIVLICVLALVFFSRASRSKAPDAFVKASKGKFEVTISGTGELLAEKSVDILAPELLAGGFGGGGDIRLAPMKIQDLIPEGTIVNKGDFVAQLDRTDYDNNLKDDRDKLSSLMTSLEMKNLDSAVTLSSLRDDIRNQTFLVSEAAMTLKNSKYESPEIIRQAEIAFDKSGRVLEQKERSYKLKYAQSVQSIRNTEYAINRVNTRIRGEEELLKKFTIVAPSGGMVIYKRDFRGTKRKVGTMIAPFDRAVASIPDLSAFISRTFVSEIEINRIKPGQTAEIVVDALPGKVFKGKVISIANVGEELPNSDTKVFETLIRLDEADPGMRPSMTTGNKILIRSVADAVYIPTECIQSRADSITFVYTKNRNKQVVITGISNDKFTVIEKGLKAGTTVYLSEPMNAEKFRISGKELIPMIRQQSLKISGIAVKQD